MYKNPLELIRHILDECNFILSALNTKPLKEDFLKDETLKRAIVRSLEIIGEAAKKIPSDYKAKFPEIEWKSMAGMRDRLIHDYMGTNYHIVWDAATNKIPLLKKQTESLLINE